MSRNHSLIFLISLLTLYTFSGCKSGQKNTIETGPEVQSLLWKIEGNGLSEPNYLFGTIHLIGEKDFKLRSELLQALDDAETLVLEVNLNDVNPMEVMLKTMIGDGRTLEDLMKPKDYEMVIKYFQDSMDVSAQELIAFRAIKPAFLSQLLIKDQLGDEPTKSYEMELLQLAEEKEMNIKGLETIGEQLSIIDSIPLEEQAEMLLEAIESEKEGDETYSKMIEYYKHEWIDSLNNLIWLEYPEMKDYEKTLLSGRNIRWISRMEEIMKNDQALFAVGAGHLGGEEGLIKLLRKAGYSVTAVIPSSE